MQSPQDFPGRAIVENQILLASAARTADGTGETLVLDGFEVLLFQLDVISVVAVIGDTLDVYVQTTVDGVTWLDVVHFSQVADTGPLRYVTKLSASLATAEYSTSTLLGGAAVRHVFGSRWRARWAVFSNSGAAYTFSVKLNGT